MKTCIVLCFCVVHSLSVYHAHGTKTCCGPSKWQGVVLQTIGTYSRTQDFASLAYATSRVYYDYGNKLVAVKERRLNETAGITTDTWKIMQYSEATSYIIENGRCQRLQLAEKMPSQCIPDQAVSLGTHKYPGFDADIWFVKDNDTGRATRYGVTIDSCMFLTESYITKGPEYTYVSSLYENMTQTIDDPSVFIPPSFCPRASERIRMCANVFSILSVFRAFSFHR
ncbi:hypothetical protein ACJMK2_020120 [Sinanodonta woodiana]|uniref:Uncharacterized protein n=1 Tax=Sinanodonta woodiana TaxID=1069815 RepID=A0ABD3TZ43_SINWO